MSDNYSYTKKALLRMLSENARASITQLSNFADCSRITASNGVKELEKEFGLFYTIEFDLDKLGLGQRHIIMVRFEKKPKIGALRQLLADDRVVQFASTTTGDFDFLVYAVSPSSLGYMRWETLVQTRLAEYGVTFMPSQMVMSHIGFIPLSSQLVSEMDMHRFGLDETDKAMLLQLNENSRISYRDLAKLVGVREDTLRYRFMRLNRAGIIRRFTVVMKKPPTVYNAAFFVDYKFTAGTEARAKKAREYYMSVDGRMPLVNKFQVLAPISGSHRFFVLGCFENDEDAEESFIKKHNEFFKGDSPTIYSAKIENVVKGMLPIRNIDVRSNYRVVNWE
ncbi:MAG: Lrp/AsnC family transcriptional regulator [Candidatus Micrarchaeia archaeon]